MFHVCLELTICFSTRYLKWIIIKSLSCQCKWYVEIQRKIDRYWLLAASHGSDGKESAWNAGDLGWIPGLGRSPGAENGNATPVFLPGESHGQKSLSWGCKESDTIEQLTLSLS